MGFTLARYVGLSILAASAVVYHAFATRQHFYRAAIYLSSSKIAVAAMGNLAFALALCTNQLVIKLFLGSLRDIEQEMIRERLSSAVMESLLALTIFREEFSTFFVAMFASLVFIKVMHWLVQDRVDYVEATPTTSFLGHLRIVSFMVLLAAVDAAFLQYTIAGTIQSSGQSVMLLFAFEYVILASTIVRYALKYGMSMVDLAMDGTWAGKGTAVFYLELIADLLHLFVYSAFFTIVFMHYGLPLHLVRDLYSTFRNFRSRMHEFLRFRQVTARLDRFPDASADDLRRCDGVCIICREEMTEAGSNKRLFCGHVFHLHCLRSWLERQQNCPTCRASVFRRPANGQQQGQVGAGAAARAVAAGPEGAPADGADGAHRHPPPAAAGNNAADGAVLRPPVEPTAAASLRHRRVAGANAGAASAAAPQAEGEAGSSGVPSRSSSQHVPAPDAAAAGPGAQASRAASTSVPAAPVTAAAAVNSSQGAAGLAGAGAVPFGPTGEAPAVGGAAAAAAGGAAGPAEIMLQGALEVLRAEHQRLVQRLIAKRQQAQQRGASVTRLMLTDPGVSAAVQELQQIRLRIMQVESALADYLADSEAASGSGPGLSVPPAHLSYMLLPLTSMGNAATGTAAVPAVAAGAGPSASDGPAAAAGSPYPSIPLMPPFVPAAAASGNGAGGFPSLWQQPVMVPMQGVQFPSMFGAGPMMMPVVPVALPALSATVAGSTPAGPTVAAVQVPMHHHQIAAAAAAAAASAAAAAMAGAGIFPNGGGIFFTPQPVQPPPSQAQQPAAATANAAGAGVQRPSSAAEPTGAAKVDEATPASKGADAAGSNSDIQGATGSEGVGAAAQREETVGVSTSDRAPEVPETAASDVAPTVSPVADGAAPSESREAAQAEEDPQEAMRRLRLQRFAQQS